MKPTRLVLQLLILLSFLEYASAQKSISKDELLTPSQKIKVTNPLSIIIDSSKIVQVSITPKTYKVDEPIMFKDDLAPRKINQPMAMRMLQRDYELIQQDASNMKQSFGIPKEGYKVYGEDTVFAVRIQKIRNPKPIKSLPMRFRDNSNYNIQYLDVEQGISSSFVYAITEDSRGNLWFGTYGGGLCRYDGKNFYVYMEGEGLSHNRIRALLEDSNGNIWVGTNGGGLCMYDGSHWRYFTDQQGLANNIVNAVHEDQNGRIWLAGDKGVVTMLSEKDNNYTVTNYYNPTVLGHRRFYCIYQDQMGRLWFGSDGHGIVLYDDNSFKNMSWMLSAKQTSVRSISEDKSGRLWFGTNGGGVVCLESYNHEEVVVKTYDEKAGLNTSEVLSVVVDNDHKVWAGTYAQGVNMIDLVNETVTTYTEVQGLSNNTIMTIHPDNSGNIWFGTNGGGVIKYRTSSFKTFTDVESLGTRAIRGLIELSNGDIWLASDGSGLIRYDGEYFSVYNKSIGFLETSIYCLLKDKEDKIWFGTRGGGIGLFDPASNQVLVYDIASAGFNGNVRAITQSKNGDLLLGTYGGGLVRFDGRKFSAINTEHGLSHGVIRSVMEDSQGHIWVGTDRGGINKIGNGVITILDENDGLSNKGVMTLYEDALGHIWMGTWGGGISKFDGRNLYHYRADDGLTHDLVLSFVADGVGNIWVATEGGINKLTHLGNSLSSTNQHVYKNQSLVKLDGLKRPGISLNTVLLDSKKRLYWGMGKGFTFLSLNEQKDVASIPRVQLNGIQLNQQFVDFYNIDDPNNPFMHQLKGRFDSTASFSNIPIGPTFPFELNHLSFDFSAIEWSAPHKVVHQYKLEGYDDLWSLTNGLGSAEYRNLPAGKYTFHIRSKGESGKWSNVKSYEFTVEPAIWNTLAARVSYVVLFILLIYGYGKIRTSRLLAQQRKLQEMVKQKTEELTLKNNAISTHAAELRTLNDRLNAANENLEQVVKERTAELQQKNDQLIQYSFDMAHKVRRPLANILGLLKLRATDKPDDEMMDLMEQESNEMDKIVHEISDGLNDTLNKNGS